MQSHTLPDPVRDEAGLDPAAVCSLPPPDLAGRLDWIRQEILPHAIESVRLDRGLAVELPAEPDVIAKIDRLVELERECCGGIAFERLPGATPQRVRLEVRGVDPDASIFESLPGPASGVRARLFKSAGIGAAASLFVCCVLPIGAVALLGAAAAPLAKLDGPVPIAVGALLGGAAAWWWLARRG